jgi:hypothetical protein
MSYIINNFRGQVVAVIPDGTVDTTSTVLQLVGRSVTDYGVAENENYVWIMENFANPTAPPTPLEGQWWYNTVDQVVYLRAGNAWSSMASVQYVEDQKVSPVFSGVPQAPTANVSTANNQIATTLFVQNQKDSPAFTGIPTAPTAANGSYSNQVATTLFVKNTIDFIDLAPRNSPNLIGIPTAPTASNTTANAQLATTAFVRNFTFDTDLSPYATKVNANLSGIPRAPTANISTANTQIATTGFVQTLFGNTDLSPYATKLNANLTGVPIAPTAANTTSTNQIATTEFVQLQKANIVLTGIPRAPLPDGTDLAQITTVGFVNGAIGNIDLSGYALLNSPLFVGTPRAPTPAINVATTQIATTEFVQRAIGAENSNALWQGSAKYVSTADPVPGTGRNGDFWFKYQP